jgi:hypothetical protein
MSEPEERIVLMADGTRLLITDYELRWGGHSRRFSVDIFFPLEHPLFGRDHQYMPVLIRGEWKSSGNGCDNTWRVSFDVEYPSREPVSFDDLETLVYSVLFN